MAKDCVKLDNVQSSRCIVEIRSAQEHDKGPVLEFCKDTFSWGDYIADVWDKWRSSDGLYVCDENGLVVGVYHIAFLAGESWLEGMRVHPRYRKKGLGTKMMLHAESIIQKGTVRLVIESENQPSINLVKSVGYHIEEEWRLYSTVPQRQNFHASVATSTFSLDEFINSDTYADSWKWLPLGRDELENLVVQGRVLVSTDREITNAIGIWNKSKDFPQTLQVGFVNGTKEGMEDVLRFAQDKAHEMGCERIQVFAPEDTSLDLDFLEKKSMFYLMRKELGKIYNL
ncbi:MAG: GNAT family N-acetyltransferase [Thaumarchaeota archaeon]|nr:GNAT family N-acetyltransferase [Nitrososphaerota archaeon]